MADTKINFQWTGINSQGDRKQGVIQANDAIGAQQELNRTGIEVITLEEKKKIAANFNINLFPKKVKTADILLFTRYLSTMLAAGLPIVQALDIVSVDQEDEYLRSIILSIKSNVTAGKTLAESFAQFPDTFSKIYCNLILAGEKSGTLDKTLSRLGSYLERSENLKRKVKKAMMYPAAIMTIVFIVSMVLLLFVVPQFQKLFKSFGAQLPAFTRIVIGLSDFVRAHWFLILLSMVFVFVGTKKLLQRYEGLRDNVDKILFKTFLIGPVIKKGIISRFARTLATTLDAGMPIIDCLNTISPIMINRTYTKAVNQISADVANGKQLSVSMTNTGLFPNMVIQMIVIGEASGSLSTMLHKVADTYEEDVNTIVDSLSSLLEPLIMLVLGVIVGGFVIAMYLPIFKLGSLF